MDQFEDFQKDEGMDQSENFQKAVEHLKWVLASSEQKDLWPGVSLQCLRVSWSRLHNLHLHHCLVAHLSSLLQRSYQNLLTQNYVVDQKNHLHTHSGIRLKIQCGV